MHRRRLFLFVDAKIASAARQQHRAVDDGLGLPGAALRAARQGQGRRPLRLGVGVAVRALPRQPVGSHPPLHGAHRRSGSFLFFVSFFTFFTIHVFHRMLPSLIDFYRLLPSFTGFYLVLLGFS